MKRRIFTVILTFILVMISSSCAMQSSQEEIRLILANVHVEDYPTSAACDKFAEIVKEKTNGRIIIDTYHDSILGSENVSIEQLQIGGIDFARVSLAPLAGIEDSLNALQLPYLYRDEAHMWSVLNGDIGKSFLNSESMKENGIIGLCWNSGGSRNFYNTKKEVKSPADLEGMKIRVQESKLMMGLVEAIGAEPVPLAFADVYSALESGSIDGAENNWPSYISTEHYKVAKYICVDEHTRVPEMLVVSKKTMDKLSAEDQQIIRDAAKEAEAFQIEAWKEYEAESLKAAEEAGCVITYLDEAAVKKFQDAVADLNKEQGAKYIDIITKIQNTK